MADTDAADFHVLKITGGPHPQTVVVELDGVQLRHVMGLQVQLNPQQVLVGVVQLAVTVEADMLILPGSLTRGEVTKEQIEAANRSKAD